MKKYLLHLLPLCFIVLLFAFQTAFGQGAGSALTFDGSSQWVDMDNFNFTPTGGFIIECWVNIARQNSHVSDGIQMFVGDNTANYRLGVDSNYHPYINFGDRNDYNYTGFTFSTNTWYHVALLGKQNGDNTLKAYFIVNGNVIFSTSSSSTSYAACQWLRIGNSEGNHELNGTIDEVRFWNGASNPVQIELNEHLTVPADTTNLIGWWHFDEGSSNMTYDQTFNNNNGLLHGSPAWVASNAIAGIGASNVVFSGSGEQTFPGTNLDIYIGTGSISQPVIVTHIIANPPGTQISDLGLGHIYPTYWIVESFPFLFAANPTAHHRNETTIASPKNTPHPHRTSGGVGDAFTFEIGAGLISSGDVSSPSNLRLFERNSTDEGAWTAVQNASSASTDSVTFDFTSLFSNQIMIATVGDSPLPIEVSSFNGTPSDNNVQVEWTTVSETNCYGFYVERRLEAAKSFTTVSGLIQGAGTSLQQHDYSWTDENVPSGVYEYRLRQVDLDGSVSYTKEINVTSGVTSVGKSLTPFTFALGQNYPNPFNPTTKIDFAIKNSGLTTLKVYNVMGQEVATLVNGYKHAGNYTANFNAGKFASGIYFYRLSTPGFVSEKKMMLVK